VGFQKLFTVEDKQGLKILFIEEIKYKMDYINTEQLVKLAEPIKKSGYEQYLLSILEEES